MNRPRRAILAGLMLILVAAVPLASAHLDSTSGSPTSFGFGGPADPDPCRRNSVAGWGSGTGTGDVTGSQEDGSNASCQTNTAVSGTYVGSMSLGAIECFGQSSTSPSPIGYLTDGDCDGVFFGPSGWGFIGSTTADLEAEEDCIGPVDTDEPTTDGNPDDCGASIWLQPEGTWDDGGLGGAAHSSHYSNPAYKTTDSCSGRQAAEDWVLGDDVPIVVTCDTGSSTGPSGACFLGAVLNNLDTGDPEGSVQGVSNDTADCARDLFKVSPKGLWNSCTPDRHPDAGNLGKGGGHNGPGVLIPDTADFTRIDGVTVTCTNGDPIVFVSPLVSANVFGEDVDDSENPHDDGMDEDDFKWPNSGGDTHQLDPTAPDGGPGDKIVYFPAGGWIDGV